MYNGIAQKYYIRRKGNSIIIRIQKVNTKEQSQLAKSLVSII